MSQYQVDSEAVLGATSVVRSSADRISAEVSSMYAQLTNLQGSWSGQAATAFQAVVTDWRATQQRVEESLAAINRALTLAAQQYAEIEAQNARMFAS
jgi:6 kDa early secretory antigenic target